MSDRADVLAALSLCRVRASVGYAGDDCCHSEDQKIAAVPDKHPQPANPTSDAIEQYTSVGFRLMKTVSAARLCAVTGGTLGIVSGRHRPESVWCRTWVAFDW
jgi:hypothetical protein